MRPLCHRAQALIGVETRRMAVAPVNLDRVAAHGLDAQRVHVLGHGGGIERLISGPLVHTLSAAAGQAQRANVVGAIGTIGPRDAELPRTLLVGGCLSV